ncbi:MAG TPA: type II secretion system protein N [Allosphingosinicella sp.]|jgi:general secretion pathway protein C
MAVALNPRAERLLARLPKLSVYSALELLLLVLIAVQCARLFWAFLTPLGPLGDWKALDAIRPVRAQGQALGSFDPFFRGSGQAGGAQAPVVVTALEIRLFGVLENRATGGGSAIIGTPDGQQRSFVVGEEIMPGVTLSGVGFDHVTVTRNGAPEQLYLDQSPAPVAPNSPGAAVPAPVSPPPQQPPAGQRVMPVPTVTAQPQAPPPPPPPASPRVQTLRVNQ